MNTITKSGTNGFSDALGWDGNTQLEVEICSTDYQTPDLLISLGGRQNADSVMCYKISGISVSQLDTIINIFTDVRNKFENWQNEKKQKDGLK